MGDKDIKPYDLWFASVAYEDDPSKADDRPVLVIDEKRGIYAALKITRTPPRESFWGEYRVQKWRQAGLSDPSTIRISKFLRLAPKDFRRKIGTLRMVDVAGVQNYIDRLYKNTL